MRAIILAAGQGTRLRPLTDDIPKCLVELCGVSLLERQADVLRRAGIEDIVIVTRLDGTRVHLWEVANVIDGFEEKPNYARFDGKPAMIVRVLRTNDEDTVAIAGAVVEFIDEWSARLPEGVTMTTWKDQSTILRVWTEVLLTSARIGLVLVLIILCLFLQPRPAFWVCLGIPIAMIGGIALFNPANLTFNVITLFALILAIGLLVDDAIVVAESIHTHEQQGYESKEAAIRGGEAIIEVYNSDGFLFGD